MSLYIYQIKHNLINEQALLYRLSRLIFFFSPYSYVFLSLYKAIDGGKINRKLKSQNEAGKYFFWRTFCRPLFYWNWLNDKVYLLTRILFYSIFLLLPTSLLFAPDSQKPLPAIYCICILYFREDKANEFHCHIKWNNGHC